MPEFLEIVMLKHKRNQSPVSDADLYRVCCRHRIKTAESCLHGFHFHKVVRVGRICHQSVIADSKSPDLLPQQKSHENNKRGLGLFYL